jgi:hypothetical protein
MRRAAAAKSRRRSQSASQAIAQLEPAMGRGPGRTRKLDFTAELKNWMTILA